MKSYYKTVEWLRDKDAKDRVRRAAPDLLEACKLALQNKDDLYCEGAIEALQAAIAKAEGKS